MKRLHDAFETYRSDVIPSGAGSVQVHECRLAFYAGAAEVLMEVLALGAADAPEDVGVEVLESLRLEIDNFITAVQGTDNAGNKSMN